MISRKTIQDLVETIQAAHAQLYTNSGQPILVVGVMYQLHVTEECCS